MTLLDEAPDVAALRFLNLLDDNNWRRLDASQHALEATGLANANIRQLRSELGSRDPDVREATSRHLLRLRERVVGELIRLLRADMQSLGDLSRLLSLRLGWVLAQVPSIGSASQMPMKRERDDRWEQRWSACDALIAIGPATVPSLIRVLRGSEPRRQKVAAEALGRIGPPAEDAVPDLIALLENPVQGVAETAAQSLVRIGPAALEFSTHAIAHRSPDVRRTAVQIVGQIAGSHRNSDVRRRSINRLLDALKDVEPEVRRGSAVGLGQVGRTRRDTIKRIAPALLPALSDDDPQVRVAAMRSLEGFGDSAVPYLAGMLFSDNESLRAAARRALKRIGTPEALKASGE